MTQQVPYINLLHFDAKVTRYKSPVIITRMFIESPITGERVVGYSVWEPKEDHPDPKAYLSQITTFSRFADSDLKVLYFTEDQRKPLADLIKKTYTLEADPSEITDHGLKLSGAGFVAWWESIGKNLVMSSEKIDMEAD